MVDILYKLVINDVSVTEPESIELFVEKYEQDHITLLSVLQELQQIDDLMVNVMLEVLSELQGPIGVDLLAKVCFIIYSLKSKEEVVELNDSFELGNDEEENVQ